MKVYLFGSKDLYVVPDCIREHIVKIMEQLGGDVEFMVKDGSGIDCGFHEALSAIGARKYTKIYTLGSAKNNKYDLDEHTLELEFDPNVKEVIVKDNGNIIGEQFDVNNIEEAYFQPGFYEIRDRYMAEQCDFAICFTEPDNKAVQREITKLSVHNKYVYTYKVAV